MATVPEEIHDIASEKKAKNPWWLKALFHCLMIGMLLDMAYGTTITPAAMLFSLFILFIWAFVLGPMIKYDKIILSTSSRIILVLLAGGTIWEQYPNVIKMIHWIGSFFMG